MTERSVTHATFVLERRYGASPARVFAAWADQQQKSQWFGGGGEGDYQMDFRVGGRESNSGKIEDGPTYAYDALYQDIVDDERIVYTYDMHLGGERISVSVCTVEFSPEGDGTRLVYTEQGAFLDGLDDPNLRQNGTGSMLDTLGKLLEGERAEV